MIDIAIMIMALRSGRKYNMSEGKFQKRIRQFGLEDELFQLPVKPFTFLPLPDIVWQLRHVYGWSMDEVLDWFLTIIQN